MGAMMMSTTALTELADQFRIAAGGLPETTLSYRIFGDSKKLAALRGSADITVGRFNAAMCWMAENWPEGHEVPPALRAYAAQAPDSDFADPARPGQNTEEDAA